MPTILQTLQQAAQLLSEASDTPLLDAEILLAHVLQTSRMTLRVYPEKQITKAQCDDFEKLLAERQQHEPIAYIIGYKEFWSLDFEVNQHTLVPRPDTELLVETALALFSADTAIKVLDLGTGSGAIAIALASERPRWQIDAVDISQNALTIARKNAQRLGQTHISFYLGNWFTTLPSEKYDLIVSNPPYVSEKEWPQYADTLRAEPEQALVSGEEGLDDLIAIATEAPAFLKENGYLLMEHGELQGLAVRQILMDLKYQNIRTLKDLSGKERVTVSRTRSS